MGRRHELGQRWAAKDPIVWQGDLADIEDDLLCPIVQLTPKHNGQRDFTFRLAPSRVDPLKRARLFEVSIRNLQLLDHSGRDQIQTGPALWSP